MRTVIVLSALAETTVPRRSLGAPGPCSIGDTVLAGPASPRAALTFARLLVRYRERAAALALRASARSSGVAPRRTPRRARAAALRSLGVWGMTGSAGSGGAPGAAASGPGWGGAGS